MSALLSLIQNRDRKGGIQKQKTRKYIVETRTSARKEKKESHLASNIIIFFDHAFSVLDFTLTTQEVTSEKDVNVQCDVLIFISGFVDHLFDHE